MSARADIEQQIAVEAAACVEQKKRNAPLGGFFTPRKALEPECTLAARNKYAGPLAAAEAKEYAGDDATMAAYIKKIQGGDNQRLYGIIAATFVFMLLIVIILY